MLHPKTERIKTEISNIDIFILIGLKSYTHIVMKEIKEKEIKDLIKEIIEIVVSNSDILSGEEKTLYKFRDQ
jgi:hypothetical protein